MIWATLRPSAAARLSPLVLAAGLIVVGCRVMPGTSPSASATTTSPSPGATTTATLSPTSDPVAAFFGRFADDPPPYHVVLDVEIGGMSEGTARIEGDVDGMDYHAHVRVELAELPPRESEIVFVDGIGYLREAGDESWVGVPDYRSVPPLNPFLVLDPADFSDAGDDPGRGGLRRLSSSTWIEQDATLGYRAGGVSDVRFDVWLDGEGVPVEAELDFDVGGIDPDGRHVQLEYTAEYAFSNVGTEVTIEPPLSTPPAAP